MTGVVPGLTLVSPAFLLLALLLPVAIWWRRRRGTPAVLFSPGLFLSRTGPGLSGEARDLPRSWRTRILPLAPSLEILGLLLVTVALARPVVRIPVPRTALGIDILLCVDVSSSMSANDLDPARTRLDVAKDAARRFVAGRAGDRIGLIAFARYPDLLCPPTPDHDALAELLAAVAPVRSDGPEDATGIGTAVARAAQVLESGDSKSKVVILLTDGEENVATAETPEEISPLQAGQLCAKHSVRVYSVAAGLGSRGASGDWTPVDTRQMRDLSERTGGRFFAARDAGAVAGVYAEIDRLERAEFAEPRYRFEERFPPLLAAALALLVLGRLFRAGFPVVLP